MVSHFFFAPTYVIFEEKSTKMKKNIAVHLANGFEEIEAISIIDVLRRADLNVIVVSIAGGLLVNGAHQIVVKADQLFDDTDYSQINMIVLPGGMPGASNLDAHDGLKAQIKHFHSEKKPLAAICAAPLVYGNLGILEGKTAVCYPGFEKYLKGAEIKTEPVAESGHIITGRGPGAAIHFALKIVARMVSEEKATQLAQQMLVS